MSGNNLDFDALPDAALIRQRQLLPILPFSNVTLWRRVKDGSFPRPHQIDNSRITCWRVGDVRKWLADQVKAVDA